MHEKTAIKKHKLRRTGYYVFQALGLSKIPPSTESSKRSRKLLMNFSILPTDFFDEDLF